MSVLAQLSAFSGEVRTFDSDSKIFDPKKLSLYQSLVFNNLSEVISPCFPLLKSIMGEAAWRELILDFFKESQLSTPIYHELPFELVKYLQKTPLTDYPFAADLAHYEWIELEVELAEVEAEKVNNSLDYLLIPWRLSNSARLVTYQYDVHNINTDYQPTTLIESFYAVSKQADKVQFTKLAPASFQLIECLLEEKQSPRQTLEELCSLFIDFDLESMLSEAEKLIQRLHYKAIIFPV